ncbi:PilW family protein [Marinagarivorans cellulosilyticus]|uniref:Uncharacterized protein n=1 Tax=Marinagarivorans cellulosilyticus TaxID=2721545 RepID=A0AAN2BKZ2_9GAMM|nr:hypothetical protein [Marinagarivorans cellulosilyticus]BCD98539.1 hypothetical protein MARGE09_P2740 [Marinagarivorans cellulosilyticus]
MKTLNCIAHNKRCAPKKQLGATLIGLMIGLLVSMIGILGSLSLYKTLTKTSVDATFDTKHDGNAALTLSRSAYEIQSAGFGLKEVEAGVVNPHLSIIDAQQLVWRTGGVINSEAADVTCKRLREIEATAPDIKAGVLGRKLILETTDNSVTATCDDISLLSGVAWDDAEVEILNITVLSRLNTAYTKAGDLALIAFKLQDTDGLQACSPYGMVPTEDQTKLIRISHFSSTDINQSTNPTVRSLSHDVCIGNSVL